MGMSDYYVQDNTDLENKKFDAAKVHFSQGRYKEALQLYLSMINTSVSYKLYYDIARCYYKLEDYDNAEDYLNKSLSLESFRNPSYHYLGNIEYKKENLNQAIEYWANAFAYKPDDEKTCLNLATSYFSKGMKFQAIFYYEKYLKYAKVKDGSYSAIKNSIENYFQIGNDFYQKALRSITAKDYNTALEFLNYAVKNSPTNFQINYLLGKTYLEFNDYMHALIYLKQALCLNPKSIDVLHNLASVFITIGDYTAAYCTLRRLLPMVIHEQQEYLQTMKTINELDKSFDEQSYEGHKNWAEKYYEDNNYHFALMEYENCLILKANLEEELHPKFEKLKLYLYPEDRIIKNCLEKGEKIYSNGDYEISNRYFSKVLVLADQESQEYKLAKTRVVNV